MIAGIGTDIVDLRRISRILERYGMKFMKRILAPAELELVPDRPTAFIGGRFAAKEACAKALGTGFYGGIQPCQISILKAPSGQPGLVLHGAALARAEAMQVARRHISISHEREYAAAIVILET